jgi:hypothetical protein
MFLRGFGYFSRYSVIPDRAITERSQMPGILPHTCPNDATIPAAIAQGNADGAIGLSGLYMYRYFHTAQPDHISVLQVKFRCLLRGDRCIIVPAYPANRIR